MEGVACGSHLQDVSYLHMLCSVKAILIVKCRRKIDNGKQRSRENYDEKEKGLSPLVFSFLFFFCARRVGFNSLGNI